MNNFGNLLWEFMLRMLVFSIIIKCFGMIVLNHEKQICAQYIYNILLVLSIICVFPLEVLWHFLLNNNVIVLPYQFFYVIQTIYTCVYMFLIVSTSLVFYV